MDHHPIARVRCPDHARYEGDLKGCGSQDVMGPDHEGMFDCCGCGIFFTAEAAGFVPLTPVELGYVAACEYREEGAYSHIAPAIEADLVWESLHRSLHAMWPRDTFVAEWIAGFARETPPDPPVLDRPSNLAIELVEEPVTDPLLIAFQVSKLKGRSCEQH